MHPSMPVARRLLAVGVLAIAAAGLAGCSDDDDSATTDPTSAAESPAPLELVADDYLFEGVPDEVSVGTALELTNRSAVELHEVVVVRLPDDEDRPLEELVALGEGLFDLAAGPPSVIVALPGEDGFVAEGDGVLAEPGRYILVCTIPVGADPEAYLAAAQEAGGPPDGFDGPPHAAEGMVAEVTVTG